MQDAANGRGIQVQKADAHPEARADRIGAGSGAWRWQKSVASEPSFPPNSQPLLMNLSDSQKSQVAAWLRDGAKLAEVQKRIETEFGLRLTYMEVKFLVSDLQVLPKDTEAEKPAPAPPAPSPAPAPAPAAAGQPAAPTGFSDPDEVLPASGVKVSIDQLARPGALVSGNVTFSDGKSASWYLDQMGRLGVAPKDKGYRPSQADMQQFQMTLEQELARQGF